MSQGNSQYDSDDGYEVHYAAEVDAEHVAGYNENKNEFVNDSSIDSSHTLLISKGSSGLNSTTPRTSLVLNHNLIHHDDNDDHEFDEDNDDNFRSINYEDPVMEVLPENNNYHNPNNMKTKKKSMKALFERQHSLAMLEKKKRGPHELMSKVSHRKRKLPSSGKDSSLNSSHKTLNHLDRYSGSRFGPSLSSSSSSSTKSASIKSTKPNPKYQNKVQSKTNQKSHRTSTSSNVMSQCSQSVTLVQVNGAMFATPVPKGPIRNSLDGPPFTPSSSSSSSSSSSLSVSSSPPPSSSRKLASSSSPHVDDVADSINVNINTSCLSPANVISPMNGRASMSTQDDDRGIKNNQVSKIPKSSSLSSSTTTTTTTTSKPTLKREHQPQKRSSTSLYDTIGKRMSHGGGNRSSHSGRSSHGSGGGSGGGSVATPNMKWAGPSVFTPTPSSSMSLDSSGYEGDNHNLYDSGGSKKKKSVSRINAGPLVKKFQEIWKNLEAEVARFRSGHVKAKEMTESKLWIDISIISKDTVHQEDNMKSFTATIQTVHFSTASHGKEEEGLSSEMKKAFWLSLATSIPFHTSTYYQPPPSSSSSSSSMFSSSSSSLHSSTSSASSSDVNKGDHPVASSVDRHNLERQPALTANELCGSTARVIFTLPTIRHLGLDVGSEVRIFDPLVISSSSGTSDASEAVPTIMCTQLSTIKKNKHNH